MLPDKVRLFESFAGIGCQRMAFDRLGIDYESVGISEIDKYAIKSYMAIHGETKNYGDITKINGYELPTIDVFTYSFPCTDLSKAGKQKGLNSTRSGLVYEVLRILQELKDLHNLPKVLIMENVVDLVQTKFIREFNEIQLELESLGYSNYVETMNAKDYGIAQNRDRVFMVSILGDYYYEFPQKIKLEKRLKDYLESEVDEKYYLSEKATTGLMRANEREHTPTWLNNESEESPCIDTRVGALTHWSPYVKEVEVIRLGGLHDDENGTHQAGSIYDKNGLRPTIDTAQGGQRQPFVVVEKNGDSEKIGSNREEEIYRERLAYEEFIRKQEEENYYKELYEKEYKESIKISEATEQGYAEAYEGDSINLAQPNSKTRRGRVGKQLSQTLTTLNQIAVVEPNVLTPKRTEHGKEVRKDYEKGLHEESRHTMTELVPREDGVSNTLTTVQKDNILVEPVICASRGRNPSNPKSRECGLETVQMIEVNDSGLCNTLTTVQKDNMVIEPSILQKGRGYKDPKCVSEPTSCDFRYDEGYRTREESHIMPTLPATHLGTSSMSGQPFVVEPDLYQLPRGDNKGGFMKMCPTISTSQWEYNVLLRNQLRIRKLTPLECWRLMGIDDECFHKASEVNSNSQLYRQAGNGIVIDVFAKIIEMMAKHE